jgi:hypothetical protein
MVDDYGLSGLNKYLKPNLNNNFNTDTALNTANLITAVRVTYILLDDSDPVKFENYGGWNGLSYACRLVLIRMHKKSPINIGLFLWSRVGKLFS